MKSLWKNKGQSIISLLLIGGLSAVGSISVAFITANAKVQVIEERENNHYSEVKKSIDTLSEQINQNNEDVNNKIDTIYNLLLKR